MRSISPVLTLEQSFTGGCSKMLFWTQPKKCSGDAFSIIRWKLEASTALSSNVGNTNCTTETKTVYIFIYSELLNQAEVVNAQVWPDNVSAFVPLNPTSVNAVQRLKPGAHLQHFTPSPADADFSVILEIKCEVQQVEHHNNNRSTIYQGLTFMLERDCDRDTIQPRYNASSYSLYILVFRHTHD